jgi:hypothetical protein
MKRNYLKKIFTVLFIFFISLFIHNQTAFCQENLSFKKNIHIDGMKKKKLIKDLNDWFLTQTNFNLIVDNQDNTYLINGFFPFENQIKYENSETISRTYSSQVNGKVVFEMQIKIKDEDILFVTSNFKHISASKGDKIEFGKLTESENAPDFIKSDYDSEWSNKVWCSLKKQAELFTNELTQELPSKLTSQK